jgi:hypothetical protein
MAILNVNTILMSMNFFLILLLALPPVNHRRSRLQTHHSSAVHRAAQLPRFPRRSPGIMDQRSHKDAWSTDGRWSPPRGYWLHNAARRQDSRCAIRRDILRGSWYLPMLATGSRLAKQQPGTALRKSYRVRLYCCLRKLRGVRCTLPKGGTQDDF